MNRLLLVAIVGCSMFFVGCPQPVGTGEICGDGIDNDGNGSSDCADAACASETACLTPDYGTCAKCGLECTQQSTCLSVSYLDDRPITFCTAGHCQMHDTFVRPHVSLNTRSTWAGFGVVPRSGSTRFIKKTGVDGSPVTCATITALATDRMNPTAIEANTNIQLQGLDVTPITNSDLGQGIDFKFVNTQTGADYLMWIEFWGGQVSTSTKMPSGRRLGFGCFEDAAVLTPLIAADDCPTDGSDAATCRTFALTMPAPEQ